MKEQDYDNLIDEFGDDRWAGANWLIVRLMTYKQYVSYAVYAAELVIDLYEKEYPNDDRPARAVEAAKLCIEDPTAGNKAAARTAGEAARVAAKAAKAAAGAAAWAAAWAAGTAAWAAAEAAERAAKAAEAAARVAAAAGTRHKILTYGLALLWANATQEPQKWELDTGNDGNDETLYGTCEEVEIDVLNRYELDELPAHWTITKVDW